MVMAMTVVMGLSVEAMASKKKVVEVTFDETDSTQNLVSNLTPEQIAQGGQLAANARREVRVHNETNEPIPVDEDVFDMNEDQNPNQITVPN